MLNPNNELNNDEIMTNDQLRSWALGIGKLFHHSDFVIRNYFIILVSSLVIISSVAFATTKEKEYDGIWFLGFNLKREVTKDDKVRQAINISIDKDYIVEEIVSKEVVPVGLIPPGMLGYDPDLVLRINDLKHAKQLMKKAGFPITDKRLKTLTLLHTDGIKTTAIAKNLQNDLRNIGMKIKLVEVSFKDEEKWVKEMALGKHDFFLMGYKAGIEQLFTEEASAVQTQVDSYSLVEPLFATSGEANFTGYSNTEVDKLLKHLSGLNIALKSERHAKLKKINGLLYKELPVIVLFYIEKL
jgi:ABC-type transport system substrate-binding protein